MIPIQRGAEPASLPPVRATKLAALRTLGRKPVSTDFKGYDVVKPELWTAQYHKCCFCEQKITRSYNAVEHYRPKTEAIRWPGSVEKNGYWWLAYTWENLLLACPVCNSSAKRSQFPLETGSIPLQPEQAPPGAEQALLLDPAGDLNPVEYIVFVLENKGGANTPAYWWAKPRHTEGLAHRLGQFTIDVCQFNHPEFRELRNDHFHEVIARHVDSLKATLTKRKIGQAKIEFERAMALLHPRNSYAALNYDGLRQLIPNEQLQAIIQKSWPQPAAIGR